MKAIMLSSGHHKKSILNMQRSFLVFGKNQQKTFRVFVKIIRISFVFFGNDAYNMLISKGETETNGTGEKDLSGSSGMEKQIRREKRANQGGV